MEKFIELEMVEIMQEMERKRKHILGFKNYLRYDKVSVKINIMFIEN